MSKKAKRLSRTRLPPAQRRAQLLAQALAVFARRGLGQGRHAEIATAAGVSVSTVFVYFPTREALVAAVLGEVEHALLAMAEQAHARNTAAPVPELLLDHIRAFGDFVGTHPDQARVWLDWSTAIGSELWPRYLALQERIVRIIQTTLEHGRRRGEVAPRIQTEDDARLVVGSAHMLAQLKLTGYPPARYERFVRSLVRAATGGAEG